MAENQSTNHGKKIVIYWDFSFQKIVTCILAVLLVIVMVIGILATSLKTTLNNPQFYKNNLKRADTYNRLIDDGIPSIILSKEAASDKTGLSGLAQEVVVHVVKMVISPNLVQSASEKLIDGAVGFMSASHKNAKVLVDLSSFTPDLQKASDFLVLADQLIPSCNQAQNLTGGSILNVSLDCKSTGVNLDTLKSNLMQTRLTLEGMKLSEVDFSQQIRNTIQPIATLNRIMVRIPYYFYGSIFALLVLMGGIIALQWRDRHAMIKFISVPILFASLFTLVIALVLRGISLNSLGNLNLNTTAEINAIVTDLIRMNLRYFFIRIDVISTILLVLAILALAFNTYDKKIIKRIKS